MTITITDNQAEIILRALANESNDDLVQFGEYSYWRCFVDVAKKMKKAGLNNKFTDEV